MARGDEGLSPPELSSTTIANIAQRVLGPPNRAHSTRTQLRYGSNGSVAVEIKGDKVGKWYDHEQKIGGNMRDLVRIKGGFPDPESWIRQHLGESRQATQRRIAKIYDYRERGELRYQVVRHEPKGFRQRRPKPGGGWIHNLSGVRRIPYLLDELRASPAGSLVCICEGEKDVDNLFRLGLTATCNSEGAGKWRSHFAQEFRHRDVAIFPDNDDAGRDHALMVAANLAAMARSVRIVALPGLPLKGDVSDFLTGGGTREQVENIVAATPFYMAPSPSSAEVVRPVEPNDPGHVRDMSAHRGGLTLVRFDDMKARLANHYLVKGLLPTGGMTVLYGDSGTGKTFLALHFALCIAAGTDCFGRRVRRAGVLYIAAEAGQSIQNRVAAAKHEIEWPVTMPFAAIPAPLDLCTTQTDVARIKRALSQIDLGVPIGLVVVDTLSRTMAAGNENAPEDMGAFVRSVDELRAHDDVAVLIVHHSGKDPSRGARGHNLLRAASDTEIEVTRSSGSRVASAQVTKQRDGVTEGQLQFALRAIDVGVDADGESVSSCIVEELNATPSRGQPRLSHQQQIALDLLKRAIDECGAPLEASAHAPSGSLAVTEDCWRRYCYLGGISPEGEQPAKQKAFKRSAEALLAAGYIGKWGDRVWLA
jgi:KaiC/GvpD/RAD55 family RecA-like ATPase